MAITTAGNAHSGNAAMLVDQDLLSITIESDRAN
jgi:hypothetical protein